MCEPPQLPPQLFVATPAYALGTWLLLSEVLLVAAAISLVILRQFEPGPKRWAAAALLAMFCICLFTGIFLLLAVSSPWLDALGRWHARQLGILAANGCSTVSLDTIYDRALNMNARLVAMATVILWSSGLFAAASMIVLLRQRHRPGRHQGES